MPEMRFTVTKKLNELILESAEGLGVDKSDYVKNRPRTKVRGVFLSTPKIPIAFSMLKQGACAIGIFERVKSLILDDLKEHKTRK